MITAVPPAGKNRIRAILVSGFLGSGKTTFINHILMSGIDLWGVVVIVNEFGELGFDGRLIRQRENTVVELTSGCICCTLTVDLKHTLLEIGRRYDLRMVLIEASGVADPFGVKNVFETTDVQTRYRLDTIVTILDAKCWRMRSVFGELFLSQLSAAGLILLNKVDLLEADDRYRTTQEVCRAYPAARILPTRQCRIDPAILLEAQHPGKTQSIVGDDPRRTLCGQSSDDSPSTADIPKNRVPQALPFSSFAFQPTDPLDKSAFMDFLQHVPAWIFRIKGPICFGNEVQLLNHVNGQNRWRAWHGRPRTQLVFIGWHMDVKVLKAALEKCINASSEPRGKMS